MAGLTGTVLAREEEQKCWWQLHNMASIFNTREQHSEVGGFLCYVYLGTTGKLSREEPQRWSWLCGGNTAGECWVSGVPASPSCCPWFPNICRG